MMILKVDSKDTSPKCHLIDSALGNQDPRPSWVFMSFNMRAGTADLMTGFRRAILLAMAIIIGGCAAIEMDRGYSFQSGESERYQRVSCAELKYYFSSPIENPYQFKIDNLGVRLKVDDQAETHWLSIGPGILIPLPIIPWPFGIVSSFFPSQKLGKRLTLSIDFHVKELGYRFNPELVILKSSGTFLKPLHIYHNSLDESVTQKAYDIAIEGDNAYVMEFEVSDYRGPMQLILDGISKRGETLSPHKIMIDDQRSIGLYWLVGINC